MLICCTFPALVGSCLCRKGLVRHITCKFNVGYEKKPVNVTFSHKVNESSMIVRTHTQRSLHSVNLDKIFSHHDNHKQVGWIFSAPRSVISIMKSKCIFIFFIYLVSTRLTTCLPTYVHTYLHTSYLRGLFNKYPALWSTPPPKKKKNIKSPIYL